MSGQTPVLTQHNDISRTGQNTTETVLNTTNVNVNQFGKLFSVPTDGQAYAQPLYVPGVTVNGATHNVLIVATEADSVYAFDADTSGAPLWKASLVDAAHGAGPGERALDTATSTNCSDTQPMIGITSTPVIDSTSNTIYVETKSTNGSSYFHRLHALDLLTGNEQSAGPTLITATVTGTGDGSTGGHLSFDALHQHARPGLLLINGTVYIAFASHCDFSPYHGWLFAYDATTLAQRSVYVTTPNGGMGGFWMAGAGVAADSAGNIYIPSGNGDFDTTKVPATETGDTLLKLGTTNQTLTLLDYFTPQDQQSLNNTDLDLGSGGVLLLPDQPGTFPHLLVQAGKEGRIYVVNRDRLTTGNTHYCSGCTTDTEIVEESSSGAIGQVFGAPAYWNNHIYYLGLGDALNSIPITNGLPDFANISRSSTRFGFPGATPSISSHGTQGGTGIVWAIDSSQYGSPGPGPGPAVLYAFDATNVLNPLWNSDQAANNRDVAGNAVKFSTPTISNGKVYVGTSSEVDVYGLFNGPGAKLAVQISPKLVNLSASQTQQFTSTVTGTTNTSVTWSLSPAVGILSSAGLYTAPSSIATAQTISVIATSVADKTQSATAKVNLQPPTSAFTPILVHSGGVAYVDTLGQTWSADAGFSGGNTSNVTHSINRTPDPTLYESERFGVFSYTFTVPNGSYNVLLKFAEIYYTSPGQRIFSVTINGSPVLTNFDIVAQAGAAFTALDKTFPVAVTNGTVTIQFLQGSADLPKVSAIEVSQGTGTTVGVQVNPTVVNLSASQTQQFTSTVTGTTNTSVTWSLSPAVGTLSSAGLYTAPSSIATAQTISVTATSVADKTQSATAKVNLQPPTSAFTPILVNSGGVAYVDTLGQTWSADSGFSGGHVATSSHAIIRTPDPTLYQSERFGVFSYTFNVPNGNYKVLLKFAEIYYTSPGQRIFGVSINGAPVLTNFDIVAQAGAPFTALDKTFPVAVTNSTITIQFLQGSADLPKISAIEIVQGTGSNVAVQVSPASVNLAASQSQQFTSTVTGTTNTSVTWSLSPAVGTLSSAGLYTAPSSIATAQTVSVTATSVADNTQSATAKVNLQPPAGTFSPILIHSGGTAAYVDSLGQSWSADTGFSGGIASHIIHAINGTPDPTLYQSQRFGVFSYTFTVPNGHYNVLLKFAETYYSSPGQRIFSVSINGTPVLTNFDIVAQAGAPFTALDKTFPVAVTNNAITIQFLQGSADVPKISAIEIAQSTESNVGIQISPTTVNLSASQTRQFTSTVTGTTNTAVTWSLSPAVGTLSSAGLYTAPSSIATAQTVSVTATSVADNTQSATAKVNLQPPAGTFSPILVHSGGGAYVDSLGQTWSADSGFSGGNVATFTQSINGTPDPTLYQSEHFGVFSYTFTVPNGNYNVLLKFAEIYYTSPGQRIFSVSINGTPVLTNFDIVAQAGAPFTALDKTFPVSVTNGTVTIQFLQGSADLPKVSAIEISQ